MNPGKQFEKDIQDSIPDNVYYLRLNDPAQSFDTQGNGLRFSPKNPYDNILYKKPIMISMELKSTAGTSLSFSLEKNKGVNIKKHQIFGLLAAKEYDIVSGLVMNFRLTEITYWMDIGDFWRFTQETSKKSINEKDICEYGGRIIETRKLKVHSRYDLSFLWEGK